MVAERQFRSTLDVAVEALQELAVDIMSVARTRHVCSAVEMMEDWVTDVENIATQRFETLAHEMKMTKVRLTELKDLKSQLRFDILDNDKDQLSNTDGRIEAVEKSISELDESVAHTVLQEGIQERIVGEIMDVPIPQVMEKTIEVAKHIPQERMHSYTVEEIVDMAVPRIRKETGEVIQLFPRERISDPVIEQTVDTLSPHIQEQAIEVVKAIPRKRLQERTANADKPGVRVQVFKGERAVTKDDDLQGQFHLNEIPSAPCGAPHIEAIFDIDAPVPQMAEQMLEVPKIIPQDRILQRTVKQAEATQVLQSETSGADGQSYSLFQESSSAALQTSTDLKGFEKVMSVRRLAEQEHSTALDQLASRISAIMKFGAGADGDPFVKVKDLITDLISRLQAEASSETNQEGGS